MADIGVKGGQSRTGREATLLRLFVTKLVGAVQCLKPNALKGKRNAIVIESVLVMFLRRSEKCPAIDCGSNCGDLPKNL